MNADVETVSGVLYAYALQVVVLDRCVGVIAEDIVDTGVTIKSLVEQCEAKGAADVRIATLLFKPGSCKLPKKPEYIGLEIPNDFIVGYGLDYDGYGRNLPEILTLVPEN